MNKLILVSTFRHLFLSLNLASTDEKNHYHVVFIDQNIDETKNILYQAAKKVLLPFKSVSMLTVRQPGQGKKAYRQQAFSELRKVLGYLQPIEIITGNDRRLEFQYAMKFASRRVLGSYVDDGTGSYVSAHDVNKLKDAVDKFIDTPIKKMTYGSWYNRPSALGLSKWTQKVYLTNPELAEKRFEDKTVQAIDSSRYFAEPLVNVISEYVATLGLDGELSGDNSVLFVLPHSSIVTKLYGSFENLSCKIKEVLSKLSNAYVKYHPREVSDPLDLEGKVKLLPANIPVELLLAFNRFDLIVGDVSSALVSAKWLQPECRVEYLPNGSDYLKSLSSVFENLDIVEFQLNE